MSYQVLARKWRPKSFDELVGQKQTATALINALESQRLHHAYLFTGTRGVGKTTIARILSKSLNCDTGITSTPCGECSSCVEIDQGNFVDLMEIDAASKTKVEDTRELLDNVQYRPTRGRYKVYLIDEVHMLSGHSFNALLKTLEEPPPHVVFLLATTDPQKLPVTVLSRCLQFHLRRMEEDQIVSHLSKILKAENIAFEESALYPIAKGADGSMRDALSLLDQGIAYSGDTLTNKSVLEMLGSIDQSYGFRLLDCIENNDATELMSVIRELSQYSPDYFEVMSDWLSLLHKIAVTQATNDSSDEQLSDLALKISPADIQLYYQLSLQAKKDLAFAPHPRQGFEMAMLRVLAFRPNTKVQTSTPSNEAKKKLNKSSVDSTANPSQIENIRLASEALISADSNAVLQVKEYLEDSSEQHRKAASVNLKLVSNNEINLSGPEIQQAQQGVTQEQQEEQQEQQEYNKVNNGQVDEPKHNLANVEITEESTTTKLLEPISEEATKKKKRPYRERRLYPNESQVLLSDVCFENWHVVVDQIRLGGNGLQVLINSIGQFENDKLDIRYLDKAEYFLTDNLRTSLSSKIRKYFENASLEINFNLIDSIELSPKDRQMKLHQEALETAYQDLLSNSCVAILQDSIGVSIDKESIKLK